MNKQIIAVGLLAALLAPATQGFAQKVPIKKIKPVKVTRTVTQSVERLVPRVPGVYIPAGTLAYSLENKVASVAKKANIHLTSSEINIIASNPERLRQPPWS